MNTIKRSMKRPEKISLFSILVAVVVGLAVFYRTYNYRGRIQVTSDHSRDVQVAVYAFDNLKIPQTGQFSSAGPFFYGPWWYWILGIFTLVPLGVLTHWYLMTFLSLVFIYLVYRLGKEMGGKQLGLLAALLAAISPAQIDNSLGVWNPAIIPFLAAISWILLIKFYKNRTCLYLFGLGFSTSLAVTIHFQSALMAPIPLTAIGLIFLSKPPRKLLLKYLFSIGVGALIPLLPLLYFDARHNWYNFVSLFIYLAIDQYSIWVPNRWLTYIRTYWPETWGNIIGGNSFAGGMIIGLLGIFYLLKIKSRKNFKIFYLTATVFAAEIVLYRYYRGVRFNYYSLFAHPVVFVLTAWVIHQVFRFRRAAGILLGLMVLAFSVDKASASMKEIGMSFNKINLLKEQIYYKYPREKFAIYGCNLNGARASHPLALIIYREKRSDTNGIKIGVCEGTGAKLYWHRLGEKDIELKKLWIEMTTSVVHDDVVEWWKKKPPGVSNFKEFIKKKFDPRCYPHC